MRRGETIDWVVNTLIPEQWLDNPAELLTEGNPPWSQDDDAFPNFELYLNRVQMHGYAHPPEVTPAAMKYAVFPLLLWLIVWFVLGQRGLASVNIALFLSLPVVLVVPFVVVPVLRRVGAKVQGMSPHALCGAAMTAPLGLWPSLVLSGTLDRIADGRPLPPVIAMFSKVDLVWCLLYASIGALAGSLVFRSTAAPDSKPSGRST